MRRFLSWSGSFLALLAAVVVIVVGMHWSGVAGSTPDRSTAPSSATAEAIDLMTVTSSDVNCGSIVRSINTSPTDSIWITVANPTEDQLLFPGEKGWGNVVGYRLAYSGDTMFDDAVAPPLVDSSTPEAARSSLEYAICRYMVEGVQLGNGINTSKVLKFRVNGSDELSSVDVAAQNPWLSYAGEGPEQVATVLNGMLSYTADGWRLRSNDTYYAYIQYAEKLVELTRRLTGADLEEGRMSVANYHVVQDDWYAGGVIKRLEWNPLYQEDLKALVFRPNLKTAVDCWSGWGVNVLDGRFASFEEACRLICPADTDKASQTVPDGSGLDWCTNPAPAPAAASSSHRATTSSGSSSSGGSHSSGSSHGTSGGGGGSSGGGSTPIPTTTPKPQTCKALWGPSKDKQVPKGSNYCVLSAKTSTVPSPAAGLPSGKVTSPASQPTTPGTVATPQSPSAPVTQQAPGVDMTETHPDAPVVNPTTNPPPSTAVGEP